MKGRKKKRPRDHLITQESWYPHVNSVLQGGLPCTYVMSRGRDISHLHKLKKRGVDLPEGLPEVWLQPFFYSPEVVGKLPKVRMSYHSWLSQSEPVASSSPFGSGIDRRVDFRRTALGRAITEGWHGLRLSAFAGGGFRPAKTSAVTGTITASLERRYFAKIDPRSEYQSDLLELSSPTFVELLFKPREDLSSPWLYRGYLEVAISSFNIAINCEGELLSRFKGSFTPCVEIRVDAVPMYRSHVALASEGNKGIVFNMAANIIVTAVASPWSMISVVLVDWDLSFPGVLNLRHDMLEVTMNAYDLSHNTVATIRHSAAVNVSAAVSRVSKKKTKPGEAHWIDVDLTFEVIASSTALLSGRKRNRPEALLEFMLAEFVAASLNPAFDLLEPAEFDPFGPEDLVAILRLISIWWRRLRSFKRGDEFSAGVRIALGTTVAGVPFFMILANRRCFLPMVLTVIIVAFSLIAVAMPKGAVMKLSRRPRGGHVEAMSCSEEDLDGEGDTPLIPLQGPTNIVALVWGLVSRKATEEVIIKTRRHVISLLNVLTRLQNWIDRAYNMPTAQRLCWVYIPIWSSQLVIGTYFPEGDSIMLDVTFGLLLVLFIWFLFRHTALRNCVTHIFNVPLRILFSVYRGTFLRIIKNKESITELGFMMETIGSEDLWRKQLEGGAYISVWKGKGE